MEIEKLKETIKELISQLKRVILLEYIIDKYDECNDLEEIKFWDGVVEKEMNEIEQSWKTIEEI